MATITIVAGVIAACLLPIAAHAQAPFPTKSIRLIVGSSAGGGGDILARTVAQKWTEMIGQQVIIDNRAGAGGNIGADLVAKAPPDGYTLLFAFTGHVINPSLYGKLPFDTVNDFSPITMLATNQTVVTVHPSVPAKNMKELIAVAKARPGKLNIASLPGSSQHLAGELFKSAAGIDIVFIPYKGNGPALNDLLGGQVDVMFNTMTLALPFIRAAKIRALAVTGESRSGLMPELPTVGESALPGYSSTGWYGILGPAKTPRDIVTRLNQSLVKTLADPALRERLQNAGNETVGNTPEQFDAFIRAEIPKWAKVVKESGAKPE
jgi:tripartite-type tricarboxylate transporter receptor subunit TctC